MMASSHCHKCSGVHQCICHAASTPATPSSIPVNSSAPSLTHHVPVSSTSTLGVTTAAPVPLMAVPAISSAASVTLMATPVSAPILPTATQVVPTTSLVLPSTVLGTTNVAICASSAASVPQLPTDFTLQEGFYRLRNARLFQKAFPWVSCCVLNWGCQNKLASQSYLQYINSCRSKPMAPGYIKRKYYPDEIKLLNDTTPDEFDTNLVIKVFDDIFSPGIATASGSSVPPASVSSTVPILGMPTTSVSGAAAPTSSCTKPVTTSGASAAPVSGQSLAPSLVVSSAIATPTASTVSWKELIDLLKKLVQKRNDVAHKVSTIALSKHYYGEVEPILLEVLEKAADCFNVPLVKKNLMIGNLQAMLKIIEQGEKNDSYLSLIREKFIRGAREEMRVRWAARTQTKILVTCDIIVTVESMYSTVMLQKWQDNVTGVAIDSGNSNIEDKCMFEKWPGESDKRIRLMGGDAGSGKTFLSQILILSWLGLINVKFNCLEDYEFFMYIECRDDRHESLKQFIKINYPKTCSNFDLDDVLNALALPGSRNLYVVEGADELNQRSTRLVEDILDQHSRETMSTCLLTSRHHEIKSLQSHLRDKGLSYRGCSIAKMSVPQQVKFLEKVQVAVSKSLLQFSSLSTSCNSTGLTSVETFKKVHIKSVFHYPLHLVHFYELHLKNPDNIKLWNGEADVMHEMYELYVEITVKKLKDNGCRVHDLDIIVRDAFTQLGKYSFQLSAKEKYYLNKEDYNKLRCTCQYISPDIDYERLFSSLLSCEQDACGMMTGIYNFPHRSTQEYLQAVTTIKLWQKSFEKDAEERKIMRIKEDNLIASTLKQMIQTAALLSGGDTDTTHTFPPDANTSNPTLLHRVWQRLFTQKEKDDFDYERYEKTIQFMILELIRRGVPHVTKNIKSLTTLLRLHPQAGNQKFQFWSALAAQCSQNHTIVQEAAISMDPKLWLIGPAEVDGANALLAAIKRHSCQLPEVVIVHIPRDTATPGNLHSLFGTIGGLGDLRGKFHLGLLFPHARINYIPCDDLLQELHNSCVLSGFQGCLDRPGHVLAPLLMAVPVPVLQLALTSPKHDLDMIRSIPLDKLAVDVRCPPTPSRQNPPRCPLPKTRSSCTIDVQNVLAGAQEWTYRCLTALVSEEKGYGTVRLSNCGLSDEQLDALRRRLLDTDGIGALGGISSTSWEATSDWSDGTRDICLWASYF